MSLWNVNGWTALACQCEAMRQAMRQELHAHNPSGPNPAKNGMSATPQRPNPLGPLTTRGLGLRGGGAHPILRRQALIPAETGGRRQAGAWLEAYPSAALASAMS